MLLQGFDKYGLWHCDCIPTPNLQKALKLKVGLLATQTKQDGSLLCSGSPSCSNPRMAKQSDRSTACSSCALKKGIA